MRVLAQDSVPRDPGAVAAARHPLKILAMLELGVRQKEQRIELAVVTALLEEFVRVALLIQATLMIVVVVLFTAHKVLLVSLLVVVVAQRSDNRWH